jgi:hypothetical protein
MHNIVLCQPKVTWKKVKLLGQKLPLKLEETWSILKKLDLSNNLRTCDFVKLKVRNITHGTTVLSRAILIQKKTELLFFESSKKSEHLSTRQYYTIVKHWINEYWLTMNDRCGG